MKKIAIAAVAAAGLLTLTACGGGAENPASQNLEMAADNMEDMADNAATENAGEAMEAQADNLEAMSENAADASANGSTDNPATAANVAAGNAMGH